MEKVTALGDMTKDMASRVREGANLQGLTKVTLRSKVIPLDHKRAVSCKKFSSIFLLLVLATFHREKATASRSTSHFFPGDDTCSFPGN